MLATLILKRSTQANNLVRNFSSSPSASTIDSLPPNENAAGSPIQAAALGLKIVAGRSFNLHNNNNNTNIPSAYIVHVKKNSVSDTQGRLQAGDEIVKWNQKQLRGMSYEQAHAIINQSKNDAQIELVVERHLE
jgi:hypothetical protein